MSRRQAAFGSPDKGISQVLDIAGVAQLVEHNVANVVVVGSNPIARFLAYKNPFFIHCVLFFRLASYECLQSIPTSKAS